MNNSKEYKSIDPKMLTELANGDNEFIREMISIFLEDVPKSYDQMVVGFEKDDLPTVARQAHKLKPSTGMIGAKLATDLASKIEDVANSNDTDRSLESMLSDLKVTLDNCYVELSSYRSQLAE